MRRARVATPGHAPGAERALRAALSVAVGCAALLSLGCASNPKAGSSSGDPLFGIGVSTPERLQSIAAAPYASPQPMSCGEVASQIAELDEMLGPDVDAPDSGGGSNWVGGAVRVLIPYRGVVRFVTGADRAERERAALVLAASARRGYLKGIRQTLECSSE